MSVAFYLHIGDVLLQTGVCPEDHLELQAREGVSLGIGVPPAHIKYPENIKTYADLRRAEYPPLPDQMDAYWKGGDAEASMRGLIMAIKAKYPKPG